MLTSRRRIRLTAGLVTAVLVSLPTAASATAPAAPAATSGRGTLLSVSCVSTTDCVAVGSYENPPAAHPVAARWNGTSWSSLTTFPAPPHHATDTELFGVACPAAGDCLAVGSYAWLASSGAYNSRPLAERWNGTTWSRIPVPIQARSPQSGLFGVACVSATDCWADGSSGEQFSRTLIEHWNGSAWSIVPSPNPRDTASDLASVACPSRNECWAVGSDLSGQQEGTLTERWNGSAWSVTATPAATGNRLMFDVSCSGDQACLAVGVNNGVSGPGHPGDVAQRWTGKSWVTVTLAKLADASLNGVSCVSASDCESAGSRGYARTYPLAGRWTGTAWRSQPTPALPGKTPAGELLGITCLRADWCWAVGDNHIGLDATPIEEHWNGQTWSLAG